MIKISFTAKELDADYSPIVADKLPKSDTRSVSRRVSRVATLDGGSVILDSGHGDADRTLTVDLRLSPSDADKIYDLQRFFSQVVCSCDDGCFSGAISSLSVDGDKVKLKFQVEEKISG